MSLFYDNMLFPLIPLHYLFFFPFYFRPSSSSTVVSGPFNIAHKVHVSVDEENGLVGLPPEWQTLLKGIISKEEIRQHPQAVIDVMQFNDRQRIMKLSINNILLSHSIFLLLSPLKDFVC